MIDHPAVFYEHSQLMCTLLEGWGGGGTCQ